MRTITTDFADPTFEEYVAAFGRTTSPRGSQKGALILIIVLVTLGLIVGAGVTQVVLFVIAASLVIFIVRAPKSISRAWARHVTRLENREMFGQSRAVIDERGILFEFRSGHTEFYPWEPILRVEDIGAIRLMHTGVNSAAFVLRRAVSSEDWHEWTELLKTKIPSEKLSIIG